MAVVKIKPTGSEIVPTKPVPIQEGKGETPIKKEESIITRLISILIMDLKSKVYGERFKRPEDWEKYDRFERLAKGER
jgi:hypothetical protein